MSDVCANHDVSVIICAYTDQRWDELVAAVRSVERQTVSPVETIVVVDQNEPLLDRIREQIPGVTAIRNDVSPGLSGARNSGVAVARGEILAFLDDDAIATTTWLERLVAHYDDAQVIGVGGVSEPLWMTARPEWFPEEFYWVVGCTHRGTPRSTTRVRNLIGTNMSFRRCALERASGFSSEIGQVGAGMARCDDTEVCIRLQRVWPGYHLLHDVQARVLHHVPPSRVRWRYFCVRCFTEGTTKARLSRFVGTRDGLSAERSFILRTLPSGLMRDLLSVFVHRDITGFARASAIIVGLSITMLGYLVGTVTNYLSSPS